LKNGWVIPNSNLANGTDYKLRAGITFVGIGTNLPQDGHYPLLVQAKESFWMGGKKYAITFAKGQVPRWSVLVRDQLSRSLLDS
jgi:hypothetical protein